MKNAISLRFLLVGMFILVLSGCNAVQTVPFVDIQRYMGTWYQISAYETSFNKGLVGVTADYRLLEDGSVEVYNKGFLNTLDGPVDEILGNAVVADNVSNARLKVSFPGVPNFPFPNYLIVVLDDINYEYAVVSDPFRFTLFVLSRTPQMPPEVYAQIIEQLKLQGFNTNKLVLTLQPGA